MFRFAKSRSAVILLGVALLAMPLWAEDSPKKSPGSSAAGVKKQPSRTDPVVLAEEVRAQRVLIEQLQQQMNEQAALLLELRPQLQRQKTGSPSTPATEPPVSASAEIQSTGENSENPIEPPATAVAESRDAVRELKTRPQEPALTAGWDGSHPFIRTSDNTFLMKFGGRMQLDYRAYQGEGAPGNSFFIRRARFEADGHLFKNFEYKVQADFTDSGSRLLRDAYLNINANPALQVKMGQFKEPFSQEELQSSKYIDFVERSSVNNLVPRRSPGVMVHGKRNGFEYSLGAFNGQGVLRTSNGSRPEAVARLRYTTSLGGGSLGFGGAVSNGNNAGGNSFEGRTASRSVTFFNRVPVNGDLQRYNAEFWWTRGRFSLRGEYDQTNQFREGLEAGGGNLPGVIGKGFVAQATYLFTGETKGIRGIKPKENFLDGNGGRGAWELAYRFERLQLDDSFNANHATAHTIGVNWWMNKFVRYQSNFIFERFNDLLRTPEPGDGNHFSYLSRIQVIF